MMADTGDQVVEMGRGAHKASDNDPDHLLIVREPNGLYYIYRVDGADRLHDLGYATLAEAEASVSAPDAD